MSVTTAQARSPLPRGIEDHEGRWVAIRDGEIVAVADTIDELYDDQRVSENDVLYRVPERGTYFY